jgi:hypothetical protein
MPLENANFVEELTASWPTGTDPKNEGDNHIRVVKTAIQGSFPGMSGAWNTSQSISMVGASMGGAVVANVGDPVADLDAVNRRTLTALVPGHLSWGAVGGNGTYVNTPGSGDWTAARIAVGIYDLVFNRAVTGTGAENLGIGVTPFGTGDDVTSSFEGQADRVTIRIYMQRNGQPFDNIFSFIRMVA